MSIKNRLRLIEKSRHVKLPWLVLEFLIPTPEQLDLIEQAKRTGQFCVVFNPLDASAWIQGSDISPWWENEVREDEIIH
ncbi:MAG: hypothetical protein ACXW0Q_05720 [Methylovulum sp.]